MAKRHVYRVSNKINNYVEEVDVEFTWYPGFAISQKQRSIRDLHEKYLDLYSNDKILEISSKSENEIGVKLSAFNLMITSNDNRVFSVESAFQSSKKFELGGPYLDILDKTSREAKKDERLKKSGNLIAFQFYGKEWPLEPKTIFYDWLYVRAVYKNKELSEEIVKFDAFTDIEFNPEKSINCQARSAALFVCLHRRGLLDLAMKSIDEYTNIIDYNNEKLSEPEENTEQLTFRV